MSRIPPLLLAALLALTPVMGAVCAEGCHDPAVARQVQPAAGCEHDVAEEGSPVLTGVACSPQRTDFVIAATKTTDLALTLSLGVTQIAMAPNRVPALERYLRDQPPPVSSQAVLRI
jgi:hypothetical protein